MIVLLASLHRRQNTRARVAHVLTVPTCGQIRTQSKIYPLGLSILAYDGGRIIFRVAVTVGKITIMYYVSCDNFMLRTVPRPLR